jgi:hypothetical protein
MIVDFMASRLPGLRDLLDAGGAHIVRVPFPVCPYDDSDGRPGLLWTSERIPLGLIARRSKEWTDEAGQRIEVPNVVDTRWADPPFQYLIIASETDEPGFLLAVSRRNDPPTPVSGYGLANSFLARWTIGALLVYWPPGRPLTDTFPIVDGCVTMQMGDFVSGIPPHRLLHALADGDDRRAADETIDILLKKKRQSFALLRGANADDVQIAAPADWREWLRGTALAFEHVVYTLTCTTSLMNARNVASVPVTPVQTRAARRRGEPPPYRFHVLRVPMLSPKGQGESPFSSDVHVAVHWVRGHFKQYTADKPLFGRLTGLYWWQPHLAGRAPRVVAKDYLLTAATP